MKKENEAPPVEVREPKRSKNEQVEAYLDIPMKMTPIRRGKVTPQS